mmetsp:Transcript_63231/g.186950  ORF Transcript_63231/g.186950 Transcript_63231/m.186950 type:complete len:109 (+) Transcript_63231:2246-2572(+)
MNNGKVVEVGNHEELMAIRGSQYHQLVEVSSLRGNLENSPFYKSIIESTKNGFKIEHPQFRFVNVHFGSYLVPRRKYLAAESIWKNGETLALVGPSGSDKSSLVSLAK